MNLFHINGTFLANQKACPLLAASLMLSVCSGACCLLSQLITSPQCARGLWGSHCRLLPGSNSKMQNRLRETSQKESGEKGNIIWGRGGRGKGSNFYSHHFPVRSCTQVKGNSTSRGRKETPRHRDVTHSAGRSG